MKRLGKIFVAIVVLCVIRLSSSLDSMTSETVTYILYGFGAIFILFFILAIAIISHQHKKPSFDGSRRNRRRRHYHHI